MKGLDRDVERNDRDAEEGKVRRGKGVLERQGAKTASEEMIRTKIGDQMQQELKGV